MNFLKQLILILLLIFIAIISIVTLMDLDKKPNCVADDDDDDHNHDFNASRRDVKEITMKGSHRKGKIYFPIFEIIQFPNAQCITKEGLHGTCYSLVECQMRGGINRGYCARGFGVCCFWNVSCGDIALFNRTYFYHPGFPNTINTELKCELTITLPQVAPLVCQIRLDFIRFSLANPRNTICDIDGMSIQHPFKLPILCGNLTGQHMYIEATSANVLNLVITITGKVQQRYWLIELTYLECDNPMRAPVGCLQYYTGLTGTLQTFNFNCIPTKSNSPLLETRSNSQQKAYLRGIERQMRPHEEKQNGQMHGFYRQQEGQEEEEYNGEMQDSKRSDSHHHASKHSHKHGNGHGHGYDHKHMTNGSSNGNSSASQIYDLPTNCLIGGLDYNICLRIEEQICGIMWSANHFDMGTDGLVNSQRGDTCQDNYIVIANAFSVNLFPFYKSFDRFCGTHFNVERNKRENIEMMSYNKPFRIGVKTSQFFIGPFKGVEMTFMQRICVT